VNGRPVAIDGFSLNRNASNDLGGHTTSNPEFQATVGSICRTVARDACISARYFPESRRREELPGLAFRIRKGT